MVNNEEFNPFNMEDFDERLHNYLRDNNYENLSLENVKSLVDDFLKIYMVEKIPIFCYSFTSYQAKRAADVLNVDELFEVMLQLIPETEYKNTLKYMVDSFLNLISNVQVSVVQWDKIKDDIKPEVSILESGRIEILTTNYNPDLKEVFLTLYDAFNNKLKIASEPTKRKYMITWKNF